jgi:hypothetical protein
MLRVLLYVFNSSVGKQRAVQAIPSSAPPIWAKIPNLGFHRAGSPWFGLQPIESSSWKRQEASNDTAQREPLLFLFVPPLLGIDLLLAVARLPAPVRPARRPPARRSPLPAGYHKGMNRLAQSRCPLSTGLHPDAAEQIESILSLVDMNHRIRRTAGQRHT